MYWLQNLRKVLGKASSPRKSHVLCQKCGSRMLIHTTYYRCQLCGVNVPKPKTARPKDHQPVDNLVLRLRARLYKQEIGTPGEFKPFDPPKGLAAEYGAIFGYGALLLFWLVYSWIFSPSFSASNGFGTTARACLSLLLVLNVTVLWNMAISSYSSRSIVAMIAFCSGLALVVLVGIPQRGTFGAPAGLAILVNSAISVEVVLEAGFLLWSATYLIRAALVDEPKK